MDEKRPYYDEEWDVAKHIGDYFGTSEDDHDFAKPVSDNAVNLLNDLYDNLSTPDHLITTQCLYFLLNEVPNQSTGREELCYLILRPYILDAEDQPPRIQAQIERIGAEVNFMAMHHEFERIDDDLNKLKNFDQSAYDERTFDLLRIETAMHIENDLFDDFHDMDEEQAVCIQENLTLLNNMTQTKNIGLEKHLENLSDRLLERLNNLTPASKPQYNPGKLTP